MYTNLAVFARLFINNRRFWIPCMMLFCLCALSIFLQQSNQVETSLSTQRSHDFPYSYSNSLTYDEVKSLLDQLFDSEIPLVDLQSIWNKIIEIWKQILKKFLRDACELCHENDSYCYESIDLNRYVYYINESFYPINESKRPVGMGIYYYFDLKTLRSVNNSILPTDVSYCDYFHMMQLMINVQTILHQAQIKYFLTKGTLIGVLRHHDVIPWDTDIDLFIPSSATQKILNSFRQVNSTSVKTPIKPSNNTTTTTTTPKSTTIRMSKDRASFHNDLVVYRFKNIHRVTSYKIFSLRSPLVNKTNYRWPKIDIFPYEENKTHIYAYPKHQHNLGTMNYLAKSDLEPIYLRILGPLLVPSPRHLRLSLKAMIKLGRSNLFYACEGNTFLHRYNRGPTETWRVPCKELHRTYPFVQNERNLTTSLCFEELKFPQLNQSLSLYQYRCAEDLRRTL
ncbi:unnamed protein product [Rotaria socialis]|uniref:LicD/FKTN/FKRP nucleotidyltransferase domain-containing protein n=2 Tax=Rotaria socialis TaxID=392032 RepID=A0A817XJX7_9BILA|nr:unnamed protein product [Rotaria socialis]CAF3369212.1 unnamed protein product [Rotaria socialis]CAF3457007.1 unnamed protein product [Rotaria socialis]CAF3555628.1 unnamed protein product [Rotaria socialis]CAF4402964.1 unnamed protein product [Rotaria socialis]